MFILIVCTLPAKESGRWLHLCKSDLTVAVRAVRLSSCSERIDLVIAMPRYLNPGLDSLKGIDGDGKSAANRLIGKHFFFFYIAML